jgi:hypothetical protein
MTLEPLPSSAEPSYLTEALRRSGVLGDGCISAVAVKNSRKTILSQIIRLDLSYTGAAAAAPGSIILKTGLPERADARWNSGRHEVAFYTHIASAMPALLVPRCFDAVWDAGTNAWHLLLEDLTDSHLILQNWPLPPTLEQSRRIIAARAHFHAAWWDDPRLGSTIGTWLDPDGHGRRLRHSRKRSRVLPTGSATGCPGNGASFING